MVGENVNKNSALIGNLACFTAYAIFGFNIISCKSIAIDGNITPMALFCLRSFGATVLFWIWSLFTAPHDHIEKKDIWKVAVASFLGLFMTQLSFLFAITQCTAIDASIMSTLSPIMTLIISAIVIKEKITWSGVMGIAPHLLGGKDDAFRLHGIFPGREESVRFLCLLLRGMRNPSQGPKARDAVLRCEVYLQGSAPGCCRYF